MSLGRAPSFLISMLESRGSRIFLNFLGGVQKNQECQESSVEEAAGAERSGRSRGLHPGGRALAPPYPQPSFTRAQFQSTGKCRSSSECHSTSREQLEIRGLHLLPLTLLQGHPDNTFKKNIYLVVCGESYLWHVVSSTLTRD